MQRLEQLDHALVVLDDMIMIQAVAVLVEIILSLGARELLDVQDRLPDAAGLEIRGILLASANTSMAS